MPTSCGSRSSRSASTASILRMAITDAEVAIAAVVTGVHVVRAKYGASLSHFVKSPGDFATDADIERRARSSTCCDRYVRVTVSPAKSPAPQEVPQSLATRGRLTR
jgi:hypothetical protein